MLIIFLSFFLYGIYHQFFFLFQKSFSKILTLPVSKELFYLLKLKLLFLFISYLFLLGLVFFPNLNHLHFTFFFLISSFSFSKLIINNRLLNEINWLFKNVQSIVIIVVATTTTIYLYVVKKFTKCLTIHFIKLNYFIITIMHSN